MFNIPKAGTIAGSFVTEGKITRKAQLRLVRDSVVIYTGKVGSLRRFKDDASEVAQGYECGLSIEGYGDLREGDVIEAFEIEIGGADAREPERRRQARLATDGRRDRRDRARHAVPGREPLAEGEADGAAADEGSACATSSTCRSPRCRRTTAGSGRCWAWRWSGNDRAFAESALDEVLRFIRGHVQVSNEEKELQSFGDELAGPDFKHWEE